MVRPNLSAEQYWSRPEAVQAMSRWDAVSDYERWLVEEAVDRAGGREAVHDVHVLGVGSGRELPLVRDAAPVARIHAWDVAPSMVDACRERVSSLGLEGVRVGLRDVTDLDPGRDGRGQVVVALNAVLGYVVPASRRLRAVQAVCALLEPDGVLAFVVQQRRGRPDWAVWFAVHDSLAAAGALDGEPGDRRTGTTSTVLHHHYTRRELQELLELAGFTDVRLESLRRSVGRRKGSLRVDSPNPLTGLAVR